MSKSKGAVQRSTTFPSPRTAYNAGLFAVVVDTLARVRTGAPLLNEQIPSNPACWQVDEEDTIRIGTFLVTHDSFPSLVGCESLSSSTAANQLDMRDYLSWTRRITEYNTAGVAVTDVGALFFEKLIAHWDWNTFDYPYGVRFTARWSLEMSQRGAGDRCHISSIATKSMRDSANRYSDPAGVPIVAYDGSFLQSFGSSGGVRGVKLVSAVFVRQTNSNYRWNNLVDTWAADWSPWSPLSTAARLRNPSITTNAYHPAGDTANLDFSNNHLTAVAFELAPLVGGPPAPFVKVFRYEQQHNWTERSTGINGCYPVTTFQTYGHYTWAPQRNISNAVCSQDIAAVDQPVTIVDPAQNEMVFAKTVGDSLGLSWQNYRSYRVGVDSFDYFAYTFGRFVRCPVSPDSSPRLASLQDIPDSLSVITKGDIERVLTTETFPITSGDTIIFYHDVVASDSVRSYLNLGAGNAITYVATLVTNDGSVPLDTVAITGAGDTASIVPRWFRSPLDTVVVTLPNVESGHIHIQAIVTDADTLAYVRQDSVAYRLYNIFALDSTMIWLGKAGRRYAGRAGFVPRGSCPLDLAITPNPSRGSVTISFTVPPEDAGDVVELRIFDMQARDVLAPVRAATAAGRYSIERDETLLPAGEYVVAVYTRNNMQSKMLVVTK